MILLLFSSPDAMRRAPAQTPTESGGDRSACSVRSKQFHCYVIPTLLVFADTLGIQVGYMLVQREEKGDKKEPDNRAAAVNSMLVPG